jgi:hypothetical protein
MFEMAKAMGDIDEATVMKGYARAHPEASSKVSTASSLVLTEVQTLSSAAPVAPNAAIEADSGSKACQKEETLTKSNQNSTAV